MKKQYLFLITTILLTLALSACATATPAGGLSTSAGEPSRLINVTGQGKVYLTPDIAYIYIGVHTESENVADALDENNQQAQEVTDALISMGVNKEDIQTTSFNIYPYQEYNQMGEVQGTKYVVDNSVFVTIRDLAKLGEILDKVVRSGANSINSIQFDVEEKDEALAEARQLAVEDAKVQAEQLAEAAGVELGDLMNLYTYGSNTPVPLYDGGKGGGYSMMEAAADVPIAAGQLVITIEANLAYQIQ